MGQETLAEALGQLPDRRRAHLRVHELVPVLQFSVAAMLCGARSLSAMAQWGRERREDRPGLLVALGLVPGRSPSVVTLHRVCKQLDVAACEGAVGQWLGQTGAAPDEVLAVAICRNLVLALIHRLGASTIAQTLRTCAARPRAGVTLVLGHSLP